MKRGTYPREVMDLTGQEFGRLSAIGKGRIVSYKNKQSVRYWDCVCSCGTKTSVRQSSLVNGTSRSCGCLRIEVSKQLAGRRATHGLTYTPEYRMYAAAQNRAHVNSLPFELKATDINIPEHCPVLGTKLDKYHTAGVKDNWPSLDKIVPEKGYVKDNVRVISMRANRIKSDASLEELEKIFNYIKENTNGN